MDNTANPTGRASSGGWCWAAAAGLMLTAGLSLLLAAAEPDRHAEPVAFRHATPAAEDELLPPPRIVAEDISPRPTPPRPRTFGTLPPATPHTQDLVRRHISPVAVSEVGLDLVVGRPRLLHLREAPFRIQVEDMRTFDYTILGPPTELSVQGYRVGSTGMTLWFGDRNDPAAQTILRFRVSVFP
jgi:hypothetical protein